MYIVYNLAVSYCLSSLQKHIPNAYDLFLAHRRKSCCFASDLIPLLLCVLITNTISITRKVSLISRIVNLLYQLFYVTLQPPVSVSWYQPVLIGETQAKKQASYSSHSRKSSKTSTSSMDGLSSLWTQPSQHLPLSRR